MSDDFLSPDDHTLAAGDDTEERLAEDVGLDPSPEGDDAHGVAREEHFGLTAPD